MSITCKITNNLRHRHTLSPKNILSTVPFFTYSVSFHLSTTPPPPFSTFIPHLQIPNL